jgi:hypothetical protein
MQRRTPRLVLAVFTLSFLALGVTQHARAEELFALTARAAGAPPSIFRFDTANPGAISTPLSLGLLAPEQILSIDFRPATGQLYGVSNLDRLYTIDTTTGAATPVANVLPQPAAAALGLDFNPVTDQLRGFVRRVEAFNTNNVRVDPDTGRLTFDTAPAYAPGDPNFGRVPRGLVGAAYTNNFAGASATTLYGIDIDVGVLARVEPENQGVLTTVGSLGFAPGLGLLGAQFVGFDISGVSGAAYLTVTPTLGPNPFIPQLYTVDLETGAASFVGTIGEGRLPIIGIAAPMGEVIPEPGTLLLLGTGLAGVAATRLRRRRAGARAQA